MIIYDLLHINSWNSSYGLITNDSVIQKTCFNLFVYIPLVLVRPESKIIGNYEKKTSGGHSSKKYKWCLERKSKSGMNFPKCYTFCSKRYSQPKSFELSCFRSFFLCMEQKSVSTWESEAMVRIQILGPGRQNWRCVFLSQDQEKTCFLKVKPKPGRGTYTAAASFESLKQAYKKAP